MGPEKEECKDRDAPGHGKTLLIKKDVIQDDVDNYRAKEREPERDEACTDDQKQTPNDLKRCDRINVAAVEECSINSPAWPCSGGIGMKCRNAFDPKTANMSPSKIRAMMMAYFIDVF